MLRLVWITLRVSLLVTALPLLQVMMGAAIPTWASTIRNISHLHIEISAYDVTISQRVDMEAWKMGGCDYKYVFVTSSEKGEFNQDALSILSPRYGTNQSTSARGCTLQYSSPAARERILDVAFEYQYHYPGKRIGSILYLRSLEPGWDATERMVDDCLHITCNRPVEVQLGDQGPEWVTYAKSTHVILYRPHWNDHTRLRICLPLAGEEDVIDEKVSTHTTPEHKERFAGLVKRELVAVELEDLNHSLYQYHLCGTMELNVDSLANVPFPFFMWFPNEHTNALVRLDLLFDARYWWSDSVWEEALIETASVEPSSISGQEGFYALIPRLDDYGDRTVLWTCKRARMLIEVDTLHRGDTCRFIVSAAPQESSSVEFRIPERYHFRHWSSPFEFESNRYENGFNVKEFHGTCRSPGVAQVTWSTAPAPDHFALLHNSPNPFNQETVIRYFLPKDGQVNLSIYNILGQRVRTLVNEVQKANDYAVSWDGKNEAGREVASGIYLCRLDIGWRSQRGKMVLMK